MFYSFASFQSYSGGKTLRNLAGQFVVGIRPSCTAIMMSNPHDFLVGRATFPYPQLNEGLSAGTTDISQVEVPLLERELFRNFAILSKTSSETPFSQRMAKINSYWGFT